MRQHPLAAHAVYVAGLAAIAALLAAPGLVNGPGLDAAAYTQIAVGLRSGLLPYRDLWEAKPPAIFAAFALAQAVLPTSDPWLGTWLLCVAASTIIGLLTYVLLLPTSRGAAAAGGVVVTVLVSAFPLSLGGGQTEPVAAAVALAAFVLAARRPPGAGVAAACGVLSGIAVAASFLALPALAGTAVVALRPGQSIARRAIAFAGGIVVVAAAIAAALVASGTLAEAWSALVTYNAVYALTVRLQGDAFAALAVISLLALAPLLVAAALGLARLARHRILDWTVIGAAAWVLLFAADIVLASRLMPHYLVLVAPPLVYLAVLGVTVTLGGSRRDAILGVAVLVAACIVAAPGVHGLFTVTGGSGDGQQSQAVAAWLRDHARDDDELFVWGNQPVLYYGSRLVPATPFIHLLAILTEGYGGAVLSRCVAGDLSADPPRFVVDAGSPVPGAPGLVPLLVPRPVIPGDRTLDSVDPIRQVVMRDYGPPVEVAGWLVYERLPGVTGVPGQPSGTRWSLCAP